MKIFSSSYEIDKIGIWFPYYGDTLCWIWPWCRIVLGNGKKEKYASMLYEGGFESLRDYWMFLGGLEEALRSEKIKGSNAEDVFHYWAANQSSTGTVVALKDINPAYKDTKFWKAMPPERRRELNSDYCILFVNGLNEAKKICDSIHPQFADAYVYHAHKRVHDNLDKP